MAPRKDNAISKGKVKVSEWANNGGEEEVSPLFLRVRHFPEGLPSHILRGLLLGELMAFLASVYMIGILNMASYHVNFPLLEALAERFNYQTNTFFIPTGEIMPTLKEIARISGLSLTGSAYQPFTATDDHSNMAGYTIVPAVLAAFTAVFRTGSREVTDSSGAVKSLEKAGLNPGASQLGDTGGVIWAYEHIAIVHPPWSMSTVSAALGLAYVNDSTRPRDVNYYQRVLNELSSFDWVIRGLENVPLFLPAMEYSCLIPVRQHFSEGYFPQRVLQQFRHTQNYTSSGEAIDHRPIFSLHRHSSTLLVKAALSWKGMKSSSSEGLFKQDKPTTTSNYNFCWERACPLPLCSRSSRLHGEPFAPTQGSVPSREHDASSQIRD
ncbi:hypothetical protein AMTRI_Chr12g235600 [Amborella trichopoda]